MTLRYMYCPDTPLHQIWCLYVKRFGCESVNRQTDRWMEAIENITSTADAGGII